jgi:chromosome segregation ATPase
MLTPQDLIEMRKMVAASALIQGGAFKEELDKIAKASVELDAKMGVVKTMAQVEEAAAALQKDLDARESSVRELEERTLEKVVKLQEDEVKIREVQATVSKQEADVRARLTKLTQDENVLRKAEEEAEDWHSQAKIAMEAKQQTLVDRENKLKAAEAALADKVKRAAAIVGA